MLSIRLIHRIERHADQITERVVQQIRRDTRLMELGKLAEPDLRARALDILLHLGEWLVSSEDELARRYERLGAHRFHEGVPLHEIVHALHIIKEKMIDYVRDEGVGQTALDLYAEEELQRGAERIFDTMVFYVVRGYEHAMRRPAGTAA